MPKYLQKPIAKVAETSVNNQSTYEQGALKEVQVSSSKNETSLLDNAANFVTGVGDIVSFGATKWIRNRFDIGSVDYHSNYYKGGEVAGVAVGVVATGGSTAVRAGVAKVASNKAVQKAVVGYASNAGTSVAVSNAIAYGTHGEYTKKDLILDLTLGAAGGAGVNKLVGKFDNWAKIGYKGFDETAKGLGKYTEKSLKVKGNIITTGANQPISYSINKDDPNKKVLMSYKKDKK